MLRTYRTCNLMVGFSKYEFNNKLLLGILKNPNGKTENEIYTDTHTHTHTHTHIYIYIYIYTDYVYLEVKYFSIFRYLL